MSAAPQLEASCCLRWRAESAWQCRCAAPGAVGAVVESLEKRQACNTADRAASGTTKPHPCVRDSSWKQAATFAGAQRAPGNTGAPPQQLFTGCLKPLKECSACSAAGRAAAAPAVVAATAAAALQQGSRCRCHTVETKKQQAHTLSSANFPQKNSDILKSAIETNKEV